VSLKFEKQTKSAIKECYSVVQPRIIFAIKKILPSIYKDHVPTTQQSMVVYQYVCRCDCRYVGQTSLRLQDRINQHIPKSIHNNQKPTKILPKRNCKEKINTTKPPQCDSAITAGLHLLQNKQCANNYNDQQFSILTRARSAFHLSALEATYIKTLKLFCLFQFYVARRNSSILYKFLTS